VFVGVTDSLRNPSFQGTVCVNPCKGKITEAENAPFLIEQRKMQEWKSLYQCVIPDEEKKS